MDLKCPKDKEVMAPTLHVVIIIQARMGASRLPGKPLKEVLGRPLLFYLIERLKQCKYADAIVVATTKRSQDALIVDCAKKFHTDTVRGEEEDVLSRYALAAKKTKADVIVRITADCPLMDPSLVDQMIEAFLLKGDLDYFSNTLDRTFPRGLDVEIFSRAALEKAYFEAKEAEEREHVTPYFYRHPESFRMENFSFEKNVSSHRWTVDTEEDFELIKRMIEALYPKNPHFGLKEMLALIQENPEWEEINRHVKQKTL